MEGFLKMIERIENFSLKSFKNYSGPDDGYIFLKNNIIFGYNGKGKSSLATGILQSFLRSGGNIDDTRFYNTEYIENSLLLQSPDGKKHIKGVIANFGKEATDIEKGIEEKENSKINTKMIEDKIKEQKNSLRNDIDSIHDRRKGTANIQKKSFTADVLKVCEIYEDDLDKAIKIEKDEKKLEKIIGDDAFEKAIRQLQAIDIKRIDNVTKEEFEKIEKIFSQTFDNVSIPSSNIIEWLNDGITIHESEDANRCHFCGNIINLQEIQKRVKKYNEDIRQKSILILKEFKKKLEDEIAIIKQNQQQQDLANALFVDNDILGKDFDNISDSLKTVENLISAVDAKIDNICDSKIEYIDASNDFWVIRESTGNIIKNIADEIENNRKLISSREILVKGAIGLEIRNNSNVQEQIKNIKKLEKDLSDGKEKNRNIDEEIKRLRNSKKATSSFAEYISGILQRIGINFRVEVAPQNNDYIIKSRGSDDILDITDISEGEKNILALIFFYYELFADDKQKEYKSNIKLIVIDDPVSSLDEINHMYIINLMEQVLELPIPQVFILTHSWEDFSTINYKFKEERNNPKNRFFEVKKDDSSNSFITKTKAAISPYRHHFQEVYNFSQKPNTNNLNDCDIYHIPNIIRQVLEGFLKFKIRNNSATKSNKKQIAEVLFGNNWINIKESEKTQLGELLLTVNIDSHRPTRNPEEILRSAKFLMKRIESIDNQHYNAYKEI